MAYIYKITNDINQKSYIGKTLSTIEKRFKEHCQDYKKEHNEKRPLYMAMRKYGVEHFHIEQIEQTDNPEERERYWIEYYGTFKKGYNATLGGDGRPYLDYDLIVETYKQIKNINKTADLLHISNDSVAKVLRIRNESIYSSTEVIQKQFGKMVNMYDLNNNYIQTFSNLHAAAQYMVDNHLTNCKVDTIRTHISEVCRGKRKTAAKFKWQFGQL